MFYYFNEILFLFGGVYIVNRLLYRYYFPKKPKFLPLQQLLLEYSWPKKGFLSKEKNNNSSKNFYKIIINLDDHNRLINPLLIQPDNRSISGNKIFRAYLNVMLPRFEKSIYMFNSLEFVNYCQKKANLFSLGKSIAFSETLELIPELVKRFHRRGPLFFQIVYSLNSLNNKKTLTIMPFNIMNKLEPKSYKAKISLLHEGENQTIDIKDETSSQYLNIYMDNKDVILGRPDTSLILFYQNEKNELNLAFLASNRPYFISCYQNSFYKMLEVMFKNKIPIEKTKFIDVDSLTKLIQSKKLIEMMVLFEDGLIAGLHEIVCYGKPYDLPYCNQLNSLHMKIFTLQKDLIIRKVDAHLFNQDLKRFCF